MAKIRVYELARDLNIESKLLVNTIKSIGIQVASHQSTLSDDDVGKIQAAIKGEAPIRPAASKPVLARSGGAGGSRVIRRRRKVEEPAAEEAAPEEGAAAAPAESEKEAEAVTAGGAAVEEPVADKKAEPAEASVASESSGEATAETKPAEGVDGIPEEDRPKRRVKQVAGATIVRKATPEEREQQTQKQDAGRRRTSKEDSRGVKYTGIGTQEDVESRVAAELAEITGTTRRGDKSKRRDGPPTAEETAAAAVKKPVSKQRRESGINTRILLANADFQESGEGELIETPYGQKTVYTPNSRQRKKDLKRRKDLKKTEITTSRAAYRVVTMGEEIQVSDLAKQLKIKAGEIIKKLMGQGVMATINQTIDLDTATLIANEYSYEVKSNLKSIEDILKSSDAAIGGKIRAPIVTVMGHVDHGKTSILDVIRKADVASGEAGGITQHIGAYTVNHDGRKIAFLDTPGHEAFSAMRARGAGATDIVILVVAADDGVMPQTVEAISHAKAANVPIVVAVNKIDKEGADVNRIFTELTEHGIQVEEWGGEVQAVKVSALQKTGIDELLEAVILQSEILELKGDASVEAEGIVVEAHLDTGRGPVATIMVQNGTLKIGDVVVAGFETGRVRAMADHNGQPVTQAEPSTPVEVLGLGGVPLAGDSVHAVEDEAKAKEVVDWRTENLKENTNLSSAQSLSELLGKMKEAEAPELAVILKGDTQGSVEAIVDALDKLSTDRVRTKVVHKAVGGISESDLALSETTGAVIVGF